MLDIGPSHFFIFAQSYLPLSERLRISFAQIVESVPALLAALIILFAGYLFARLVEKMVEAFLKTIRLNTLLERGGVMEAMERSGQHFNPVRILSNLVFWLLMFGVILLSANALGLESLAIVFSELVSYVPSVIAAIVIIIVGIVLGGFVGGLILASAGAIHGGTALARAGRAGVIILAVFMALQQLGVATEIVVTAFAILFGAIALAAALAFGLGNTQLAGEVTRHWYERYRAEREAIERDVAVAEGEAEVGLVEPEREAQARHTPG
jgi:hypothetical protein